MRDGALIDGARAQTVRIESHSLGVLDVDAATIIQMTEPLAGFPECRRYVTVDHVRESGEVDRSVTWLQAVDAPHHAFVVTEPWLVAPDYAPEVSDADAAEIGLRRPEDAVFLAILTIPRDRSDVPTINLRAPIVVNTGARRGKQVVLLGDAYRIRHELRR